jgi:hypothetical protein
MSQSKEYWESVCVPYEEIQSEYDKHSGKVKLILLSLSDSVLESLNNVYFKTTKVSEKDKLVKQICESALFFDFVCLTEFYRGRSNFIEEYFTKPKFSKVISETDMKIPYVALLKAFMDSPDNLIHALLYSEYKKKPKGDTFIITPSWSATDNKLFEDNLRSIKIKVTKQYRGKKFIEIASFSDVESQFFVFHRQKQQKIARAYSKNVALTGKSELFIRISKEGKILEVKCNDSSLRELVVNHIASTCKKKLFFETTTPSSIDLNKKICSILTESLKEEKGDSLRVERVNINKTACIPRTCLSVGKKNGVDIRSTLSKLQESNICDFKDRVNISSFHVNYDGISVGIELVENKDNSYFFKLTRENITESQYSKIKNKIKEEWAIEIDVVYSAPLTEQDKQRLFDFFLEYDGRKQLSEDEKHILSEMITKGIVKAGKEQLYRCKDVPLHLHTKNHTRCPDCGGNLELHNEFTNSSVNLDGIRDYLNSILIALYGKENISVVSRKHRKSEYTFLHIRLKNTSTYVYIDDGKQVSTITDYLYRSFMPTLIISIQKPLKGDYDDNNFSKLTLKDIYFGDAQKLIKDAFTDLESKYLSRINQSSKVSMEQLNKMLSDTIEYSDKDLENDVFNLMKFIFRTGQKWGSEKPAKTLPEAVIGYSTYKQNKSGTYSNTTTSIIWDCKYHGGKTHFNLIRAEIDKARRYIRQANGSKAIKIFSKQLDGYILFCNKLNTTNFENFRDALYRTRKWDGAVILFDISALTKLCDYIKKNYEAFNNKYHVFLSIFSKNIMKPTNDTHVHITEQLIDQMLKEMNASTIPSELDVAGLEKTFELDEY